MISRAVAAGFVALLSMGTMLAPDEGSARGGFRAGGLPFAFKTVAPFAGHHFHRFHHFRHRGALRQSVVGGGIGYADPPVIDVGVKNLIPVAHNGLDRPLVRVCRAEIVNVPSETGGRRDVTVTRCFRE